MSGPKPHIQLPPFDLSELSLVQLATMSSDLGALQESARSRGTVEVALFALEQALAAEILSRPLADYHALVEWLLTVWTSPDPADRYSVKAAMESRNIIVHLNYILKEGKANAA